MSVMTKKFGRKTVFAVTPEAKKKLESGWQPCGKKKGCACAAVKPAAAPKKEAAEEK